MSSRRGGGRSSRDVERGRSTLFLWHEEETEPVLQTRFSSWNHVSTWYLVSTYRRIDALTEAALVAPSASTPASWGGFLQKL